MRQARPRHRQLEAVANDGRSHDGGRVGTLVGAAGDELGGDGLAEAGHELVHGRGSRIADRVVNQRAVDDGADLPRRHAAGKVERPQRLVQICRGIDRGVLDACETLSVEAEGSGRVAGVAAVAKADAMSGRVAADAQLELAAYDGGADRAGAVSRLELRLNRARQTIHYVL